jgi:hypothetical protein
MKKYSFILALALVISIFSFNLVHTTSLVFANNTSEEAKKVNSKTSSTIKVGEKLNYTIKWNGLTAAKMSLETDKITKDKKDLYRFELKLATVGLARDLFQMNNSYTAFVDTLTELPQLVERNLSQGAKTEQSALIYDQEKHTVKIANEKPISILPNTHDLSSILWAIRSASLKPNGEKIAIFNSSDKKTIFSQIETGKQEEISLAKGNFFARELIIKLEDQEKHFSDKYSIRVWVSDDEQRVPLLITAQPSFGKVKIELLSPESEENS